MFLIGQRMRDEMKQLAQKSGCSWFHFEVLRFIDDRGRPTMRDIADHFSITPPGATLLVEGLVTDKLLRRVVDAKDRRAVRIGLTSKGKKVMEQGLRERMKKIKELFSVLDPKEYEVLAAILEKMANKN